MAQAVRCSPLTTGVPSSRLGPSMWVSCGRNGVWVGFSRGFSHFPLPQLSFHHFSTLISSISFHFISPCDGALGVAGRHPCYSRTYTLGASSHLIPRPNLVLDMSWGYLFIKSLVGNSHHVQVNTNVVFLLKNWIRWRRWKTKKYCLQHTVYVFIAFLLTFFIIIPPLQIK